jgi:hypothetical protein
MTATVRQTENLALAYRAVVFATETHVHIDGEAILKLGSFIQANGGHLDELAQLILLGKAFDIYLVAVAKRSPEEEAEIVKASPQARAMYEHVKATRAKLEH